MVVWEDGLRKSDDNNWKTWSLRIGQRPRCREKPEKSISSPCSRDGTDDRSKLSNNSRFGSVILYGLGKYHHLLKVKVIEWNQICLGSWCFFLNDELYFLRIRSTVFQRYTYCKCACKIKLSAISSPSPIAAGANPDSEIMGSDCERAMHFKTKMIYYKCIFD